MKQDRQTPTKPGLLDKGQRESTRRTRGGHSVCQRGQRTRRGLQEDNTQTEGCRGAAGDCGQCFFLRENPNSRLLRAKQHPTHRMPLVAPGIATRSKDATNIAPGHTTDAHIAHGLRPISWSFRKFSRCPSSGAGLRSPSSVLVALAPNVSGAEKFGNWWVCH